MSRIPVELIDPLKRGECVLFVGSGVSEGLPQWKELMEPLAKKLQIDPDEDPLYIAEYYENEFERENLEKEIVSQLKRDVPLTKTHEKLVEIPFKAIVTTNYDHVLEKALKKGKKEFIKVVRGDEAPKIQTDQLPLVKMHGELEPPSTIVVTKTDYDEYAEKHRALITYLLGLLISNNFLFMGFGLKDPNFDNIYTQLKELFGETRRRSYAIFKNPSHYEVNRLKRMGIEVISIDDYSEIPEIFEELALICGEKKWGDIKITGEQLKSIQKTFCNVVKRQNKWLDPRGIFQFKRMLTKGEVELENVYVVPRLVQRTRKRKLRYEHERKGKKEEFYKSETDTEREIDTEFMDEIEYTFEKEIELNVKEILSNDENKHMVILGDPGVGKTCLLKYIALKASTQKGEFLGINNVLLPVLIPLREYTQYGQGKMFKEFVFHYINEQICSLPEEVLEHFLETNSFFFLLDGLDEVIKESERIGISRQVERFMARYPHTRIILTSRPAGYSPAAIIGAVPHFSLAEFNNDEIKEFLVKWFTFLDKIEEDVFDKEKAEEKAFNLFEVIEDRERIFRLARNPLLLTILVLIQRVGGTLPERRADFYDLAVRTIVGSWDTLKNLPKYEDKHLPDQGTILNILEEIGFNLHNEKQENIVGIEELKGWLKDAMEKEAGHSSIEEINDFVWMLKERAGLLVEKGVDLYGFVHLTFQEYFAARHIASGRGVGLVENLIKENLYSSRWREVFFLASAIASPEQADLILESTLEAENVFEEYIHSNLMRAGLMLADLPRVDPFLREDIIGRLISFVGSENFDLLRYDAIGILTKIGRTSSIEDVSWALKLLHDENSCVRDQAVNYFATTGADDPKIKDQIFELLRDEES
ncbi:MAG: SIR2 family protein, partial [Candidatus Methanofastidiosia archaeon]